MSLLGKLGCIIVFPNLVSLGPPTTFPNDLVFLIT
jgi:hypothetical protein